MAVRIVKGKRIIIGPEVVGLQDYSLEVVADLLQASNNRSCIITSAVRDAFNQARVMYDVLIDNGTQYWKRIYGPAGDAVIDVFIAERKKNSNRGTIIAAMEAKINEFFSQGIRVSRHMGDPTKLQVLDIAKSSIVNKKAFVSTIKQSISYSRSGDTERGLVNHFINEESAFHIEIPIPTDLQGTGESEFDIPRQSPSQEDDILVVKYVHPLGGGGVTLNDLLQSPDFIGYDIPLTTAYDFSYLGKSNNQRMWESLDLGNKKLFGQNDTGDFNSTVRYPVVPGMVLYFPVSRINFGFQLTRGDLNSQFEVVDTERIEEGDSSTQEAGTSSGGSQIQTYSSNITIQKTLEPTLYPYVLRRLSLDPGYVPAYNDRGIIAKDIYPQLSIRAWSKVLDSSGNGFIDITCDVIRCDINSRMGGGDFLIELQPRIGRLDAIKENALSNENNWTSVGTVDTVNDECVSLHNINREKIFVDSRLSSGQLGSEYVRNQLWYNMIFQQNDFLWIKFERLGFEDQQELTQNNFGEWYDMLGLIDVVETTSISGNTESRVIIRGRDLTKVLQDDNSYFNPYSIGHASSIYGDNPFENGRYTNGTFQELSAIQARTIQQAIEFVFHRIASIGYVPDTVFQYLQDKTVITTTRLTDDGEEERKLVKGAWQCIKVFIDDSIRELRLIDDSISNPDGTIWDILNKICQDPFVEFFTDTYGDKFYIIARRPPFEERTLVDIVDQVTYIDPRDRGVVGGASDSPRTNAYKNYLDAKDKDRRRGSVTSRELFERQKAEFLNLLDQDGRKQFESMVEPEQRQFLQIGQDLGEVQIIDRRYPLIINLNEDDVLSDNLSFSNEAYSWFQVTDRGNFAGANITLGHIPALYFDDMAQIFGNRRLEVVSNYSNYKFFQSNRAEDEADLYAEQASQHLAFLVETNIHLPFTRRGTIVLNGGDRRIKKGNYIYYRPTDEIFYVTGVTNGINISRSDIDRTTRIEVERGMVLSYVKGSTEPILQEDGSIRDTRISYFNIVDIPKLREGISDAVTNGTAEDKFDHQSNMTVNKPVLDFFLQRRQFKQFD